MEKYVTARQDTNYNTIPRMRFKCSITKVRDIWYTFMIRNGYSSATAIMVTQKRLKIPLYVNFLSSFNSFFHKSELSTALHTQIYLKIPFNSKPCTNRSRSSSSSSSSSISGSSIAVPIVSVAVKQ